MDQHGAPTSSRTIAETTKEILGIDRAALEDKWGLYNLTASGNTTWYDFAKAIFALKQQRDKMFRCPRVIGIPASEFLSAAQRPKYSVLSNHKIQDTFKLTLPTWEAVLRDVLENQPVKS